MKRIYKLCLYLTAFGIFLSGCNLGVTPPVLTQPPVDLPPAASPPPTSQTADSPVLSSPPGPEMDIGSTWPYVDGGNLAAIPGGQFIMGQGGADNPQHTVSLDAFWIYRNEVTNQQYAACVAAGQCPLPDLDDNQGYGDRTRANDPVTGVNWEEAYQYCKFVNGRLPSEAEWEKAARGPNGNLYPWGDANPSCSLLNFNNCFGGTTSVITFPKGQSYYSVFDMAGNVFEWVADWYDPNYHASAPSQNPRGPAAGTQKAIRSTGFNSRLSQVTLAERFHDVASAHRPDLGFRCVVDTPTYYAPFCVQAPMYGTLPESLPLTATVAGLACPAVSVESQLQTCKRGTTYITFNSDDPNAVISGVETCKQLVGGPGDFPQVFECSLAGFASIVASCSFNSLGEPYCAEGYTFDPTTGVCTWDGAVSIGSHCPDGYTFDSSTQCCTAATEATIYPVCSVGMALLGSPPDTYKCVPNVYVPEPVHAETPILLPVACPDNSATNIPNP